MKKTWIVLFLLLALGVVVFLSGCDGCSGGDDFCPIPALSAEGGTQGQPVDGSDIGGDLYGP